MGSSQCYIDFSPEAEEEDSVNNLCSTAHFALALKILLGQFNKRYDRKFQMRIGLAYGGPVIAGVIGSKKPQYDIWGKIVNLAARMDTTGDEGKIQVKKFKRILNVGFPRTVWRSNRGSKFEKKSKTCLVPA